MHDPTPIPGAVLLGSDFKALAVARSLGRHGVPSVVIDNLPRSAWYSRYVARRVRWDGPMDDPSFIGALIDIAKAHHLDHWLLVPMQDEVVELVARHGDTLSAVYTLATQDWSVLRWACDKRLTHRMADEVGVPYPRTWYPTRASDLEHLDITYPVIVKPAISVHLQYAIRLKALPANSLDELRAQYDRAVAIISPDEIMVQEIIPGTGREQYSVGAYCKGGETLLRLTARRVRQYPIDYGLGSSFVRAVEIPEIIPLAERITRFMGITGMVEVEFKHDARNGQYKLLDINLRPWGWHSLCRACGLDFPYIHYRDLCGEAPTPREPRYDVRWARMITDLPAGIAEVRAGLLSPVDYLRSFAGPITFSVFDWRDPAPALGDLASAASRALRGNLAPHRRKAHA
jgi:D-aspartate ligase